MYTTEAGVSLPRRLEICRQSGLLDEFKTRLAYSRKQPGLQRDDIRLREMQAEIFGMLHGIPKEQMLRDLSQQMALEETQRIEAILNELGVADE